MAKYKLEFSLLIGQVRFKGANENHSSKQVLHYTTVELPVFEAGIEPALFAFQTNEAIFQLEGTKPLRQAQSPTTIIIFQFTLIFHNSHAVDLPVLVFDLQLNSSSHCLSKRRRKV
jgi:hypothetical protein